MEEDEKGSEMNEGAENGVRAQGELRDQICFQRGNIKEGTYLLWIMAQEPGGLLHICLKIKESITGFFNAQLTAGTKCPGSPSGEPNLIQNGIKQDGTLSGCLVR